MLHFVLLRVLLSFPLCIGFLLGGNEDLEIICAGKEFRLPVYSASRIVTFTPSNPPGPRRVLLDKNYVKDSRFDWTRDRTLVLKDVTQRDQGLYSIKLPSGFTYETIRLAVSECIKTYRIGYGETFQHTIPQGGSSLEFSPRGAPPEAMPVVLWNRTDPATGETGRGRVQPDGRAWVADGLTTEDQGNYTFRGEDGEVVSRSMLVVHGHTFNITRFMKESLNLPLFLPVPHSQLIFTPSRYPDKSSLGPFDPRPPRGPVQLLRDGQIVDYDMRFRGLISLSRNGSTDEVVFARLTARHSGMYDIRDRAGNLVSSTTLHVADRSGKWRAVLKSISVPSGMFVSLAGFILFMKRYPTCSLSQIINGFRVNHNPPPNTPRANIQDYSQPGPQPSGFYGHAQRKWSLRPSPTCSGGYAPVTTDRASQLPPVTPTAGVQEAGRPTAGTSANPSSTIVPSNETDRKLSFSVPGASDCLHASEDCVQFQIGKGGDKESWNKAKDYFSTLPLDTDASESCSVYTSDKLSFL